MASDSYYLIGFFSYFGLESSKPDVSVLFDVLRSIQTQESDVDVSTFEADARQLLDGMDDSTAVVIQSLIDDEQGLGHSEHFMNGWRVAELYDLAVRGGSRTLH